MVAVAIPKEILKDEARVAATPETVKKIVELGLIVNIESGAGEKSNFSDKEYSEAGAKIIKDIKKVYSESDIILNVNSPEVHPKTKRHQIDMIKRGACWISHIAPIDEKDTIKKLVKNKITCLSMNLIPRISRAQKMDSLSSQSNIAGYKSVIMAANSLGKMFPLLMTAAGTIHPAKVVVLGAGVAGLQAIATARRLGAQVEVSDIRPAVKEQVESLGAKFIDVGFDKDSEDSGGYAKKASKNFLKRQAKEVAKRIEKADVIITTALVLGKKAPVLVTEEMVKSMKPGSVIVDLAAEQGGNCELTKAGKIITMQGVKIIGEINIPATVPRHSSEMYARNIFNLLREIIKEGKIELNMEDEIIKKSLLTHDGKVCHKQAIKIIGKKND